MKDTRWISIGRAGAVVWVLCLAAAGVRAQSITLDEAKALHDDATAAREAIERVGQTATTAAQRKDAGDAKAAIGRVTERLDGWIKQLEAEEAGNAGDVYAGGTKYPAAARVRIEPFSVPVDATVVHVPVTLDMASVNTVIAYIRVFDGDGGRAAPDTQKSVIFRPGDPLTKTVRFHVRNMSAGNDVRAVQYEVADGADTEGGGIRITAEAGAVNEPIEGGRAPMHFEPHGELTYSATGATIRYDDQGGPGVFATGLPHGRTQVGNGETGYYGTVDMGGFKPTDDGLMLMSRRLDEPVMVGSPATAYPFLATVLSGRHTPETYFKYGSVEWVVKMPNRKDSWPALWLMAVGGWPPEIDVYEGFGYNGSWRFASSLSSNLHGGTNGRRTFTRPAMRMSMQNFGLDPTLDTAFHTFAATVEPEWITIFVDGVETMRYANPFAGQTWFPLTNVAVKAPVESAYEDGTGAMTVRSIKVWRAE
ncbi:MAG: family 16 glycosylhydrolase [Planctomycetes bacterium]|nr:family 16 glycosylhydrolase [Planctomycetota bacterium]